MALTPILYLLNEHVFSRLFKKPDSRPYDVVEEQDHDVVIAGFGRFGQIIGRILTMHKIPFTALESNISQVDFVRRFGNKIYYGDPSKIQLLRAAHVDKAKVFVIAIDDMEQSIKIAETMMHHYPNVQLFARARNRNHALRLMDLGVKLHMRDTLLSSIHMGGEVLKDLGISEEEAETAKELFRAHDERTLQQQQAIHHDEEKLIASAKEAAEQLRTLFESDAHAGQDQTGEEQPV